MQPMNWDDLRYVLAVSRQHTLLAAGTELAVDPTTVGRRIAGIEKQLGVRLFERTNAGYFATQAGEIAVAHAEAIELKTLGLAQSIATTEQRIAGPVRVTALDGMIDHFLIPRTPAFLAQYPDIEITFHSGARMFDLARGEAEIAIRTSAPTHPDAIGRRVGRLAVGIYAGRHFPSTENPPWIALPPEMDDTLPMKMMHELFPNSRIAARGNSEGHVQSLLRAGLGVGLVDCFAGDPDPLLRRYLPDPIAVVDLWLVVQVEMQRSPRVRAAMDFLTRILAEEKDLMEGRCCTAPPQRM